MFEEKQLKYIYVPVGMRENTDWYMVSKGNNMKDKV